MDPNNGRTAKSEGVALIARDSSTRSELAVPEAARPVFEDIVRRTDQFCEEHLTDEFVPEWRKNDARSPLVPPKIAPECTSSMTDNAIVWYHTSLARPGPMLARS